MLVVCCAWCVHSLFCCSFYVLSLHPSVPFDVRHSGSGLSPVDRCVVVPLSLDGAKQSRQFGQPVESAASRASDNCRFNITPVSASNDGGFSPEMVLNMKLALIKSGPANARATHSCFAGRPHNLYCHIRRSYHDNHRHALGGARPATSLCSHHSVPGHHPRAHNPPRRPCSQTRLDSGLTHQRPALLRQRVFSRLEEESIGIVSDMGG